MVTNTLSHDQDTIHAENRCVQMCDFCMVALMFLTGHGIKAKTHAHGELHIPNLVHHQNLKSTHPVASCFPGPDDAPRWEMFYFPMGISSCCTNQ